MEFFSTRNKVISINPNGLRSTSIQLRERIWNVFYKEEYDYYEEESYEEEEIVYEEEYNDSSGETYYGTFEGTYYEGGPGTYGASGRDLISGYSIASNLFAQGSIVRIEGSGLDGYYRVDDCGGMAGNVIDFYYQYGDVPGDFYYQGRVSIEVYLVS